MHFESTCGLNMKWIREPNCPMARQINGMLSSSTDQINFVCHMER